MEINIGLFEIVIGLLIAMLGMFGFGKLKKGINTKAVNEAAEKVGESEANDDDRDDVIKKANSVIQKNLKAIKDAKEILNSN